MTISAKAHPIAIEQNRLERLTRGEFVPRVQQQAKKLGKVGMLYSVYIDGNRDWASKGITASELALWLCARGFLEIVLHDGTILDDETPLEQYPHPGKMPTDCAYKFLKEPPTRNELYAMTRQNRQTNNVQQIDEALEAAEAAKAVADEAAPKKSPRKRA